MVEEMLAARGICVTYETVRQWGKKIRQDICRPDPPAGARSRRQMASRRSRRLDRRRTTLAVARRRPEWLRSRCSGSAPERYTRRAAAHEEAPEISRDAAARDDHGQAPFLRRCEGEDGPFRRTSPAQGAEQSRRELSSADEAARADHEAIQIRSAGAMVSVGSRPSREPLPHSLSWLRQCRLPSRFAPGSLCGLARDFLDGGYRLTWSLRQSPFFRPELA